MPISPETPPQRPPSAPRKRGYIFPILLAILGSLFLWQGSSRVMVASGSNSIRIDAPGERTFRIDPPGEYRIWLMQKPVIDGVSYGTSDSLPEGARVEVTQVPGNRLIPQRPMRGSMRMSVNGVSRVALATLTFPEAGEYRLSARGTDRRYVLLLDKIGAFWQFFAAIGFFIIGGMALTAALVWGIIVVVIANRSPTAMS